MTHLLIDDVNLLKPKIGELNPNVSDEEKANRRFYNRAVFTLVEAFLQQHRRLLEEAMQQQDRLDGKGSEETQIAVLNIFLSPNAHHLDAAARSANRAYAQCRYNYADA